MYEISPADASDTPIVALHCWWPCWVRVRKRRLLSWAAHILDCPDEPADRKGHKNKDKDQGGLFKNKESGGLCKNKD
eukprot:1161578-Pelagomonas_calceolata.AAC.3